MTGRLPAMLTAAMAAMSTTGCYIVGASIERAYDGMDVTERRIAPEAYSAYAEGAIREARGDHAGALTAYQSALDADPMSAELQTRVAALRCLQGDDDVASLFARSVALSPRYGPTWLAMSACHSKRGDAQAAVKTALHAAGLMPLEERATARVVEALRGAGQATVADQWVAGWRARMGVDPLRARGSVGVETTADAAEAMDAALARGDLDAARQSAVTARRSSGEVALRAAALGKARAAMAQAELALAADPRDADAWVAAIVAADLLRDDEAMTLWLGRVPTEGDVSDEARDALGQVLERRVGPGAAGGLRNAGGPEAAK